MTFLDPKVAAERRRILAGMRAIPTGWQTAEQLLDEVANVVHDHEPHGRDDVRDLTLARQAYFDAGGQVDDPRRAQKVSRIQVAIRMVNEHGK